MIIGVSDPATEQLRKLFHVEGAAAPADIRLRSESGGLELKRDEARGDDIVFPVEQGLRLIVAPAMAESHSGHALVYDKSREAFSLVASPKSREAMRWVTAEPAPSARP